MHNIKNAPLVPLLYRRRAKGAFVFYTNYTSIISQFYLFVNIFVYKKHNFYLLHKI